MKPFKRCLGMMLVVILCMGTTTAWAAWAGREEPLCDPSQVDLSDVQVIDGRIVGEIHLPEGAMDGVLRVDCPVSPSFRPEQMQKLTVAYEIISEAAFTKALEAIGQDAQGGIFNTLLADPKQPIVQFYREEGLDGSFISAELTKAPSLEEKPHEQGLAAAKEMARTLLANWNTAPFEDLLHARRKEEAQTLIGARYNEYSTREEMQQYALEDFMRNEDQSGHPGRNLSTVGGMYELYDLPVMYQHYWKEEKGKEFFGASSGFHLKVRDDGMLMYAQIDALPTITGTEPLNIPERSWEELLRLCVVNLCVSNATTQDSTYEDHRWGTYTRYATYAVITQIEPCWVGFEPCKLEPGWYAVTEERVVRDNSLADRWQGYTDAATMQK